MKKLLLISFIFILSLTSFSADWPMYMGNFYLTGNNDEVAPQTNRLNWAFQAPKYVTNAVSANLTVYVTSTDGYLYAVNEETGRIRWEFNTERPIISMPVISNGYVITASGNKLFCLDEKSGNIIWARFDPNSYTILGTPIIYKDTVIYGSRKMLYARKISNGHELWSNDSIESYGASPILYDNAIISSAKSYRGGNQTFIVSIDAKNGNNLWKRPVEHDPNSFTPLVKDGHIYYPSANKFYKINAKTGVVEYEKKFESNFGSEAKYSNELIYVSGTDGFIYVLSPENGETKNRIKHHSVQGTKFIMVGNYIYTTTETGELYCIESETGNIKWKFQARERIRGKIVCASNGRAYYTVSDRVYSLSDGALPVMDRPVDTAPLQRVALTQQRPPYNRRYTPSNRYTPGQRYTPGHTNRRQPERDRIATRYTPPYSRDNRNPGTNRNPVIPNRQPDNEDRAQNRNPVTPPVVNTRVPEPTPQRDIMPEPVPVTEPRTRTVTGRITDGENNNPIPGEVIAIPRDDHQGRRRIVVPVGPDGRFNLMVPEDDYDITFRAPGYSFTTVPFDKDKRWDKENIPLVRLRQGNKFTVHNISFDVHKATLKPESINELRRAVQLLRENPNLVIEIRGHTDSTGDRAYNFSFSNKRAEVVRNFLIKHGINPNRLKFKGLGPSEPIGPNNTDEGRAKNRRVEFHVLSM